MELEELLDREGLDADAVVETVAWAHGRAQELLSGAEADPELGPLLDGGPVPEGGPLPPLPAAHPEAVADEDGADPDAIAAAAADAVASLPELRESGDGRVDATGHVVPDRGGTAVGKAPTEEEPDVASAESTDEVSASIAAESGEDGEDGEDDSAPPAEDSVAAQSDDVDEGAPEAGAPEMGPVAWNSGETDLEDMTAPRSVEDMSPVEALAESPSDAVAAAGDAGTDDEGTADAARESTGEADADGETGPGDEVAAAAGEANHGEAAAGDAEDGVADDGAAEDGADDDAEDLGEEEIELLDDDDLELLEEEEDDEDAGSDDGSEPEWKAALTSAQLGGGEQADRESGLYRVDNAAGTVSNVLNDPADGAPPQPPPATRAPEPDAGSGDDLDLGDL